VVNSEKLLRYVTQKELSAEHASYVAHHPDLRALLSDFIQHLLIDKPADVLDFCAQYFDAFSPGYTTVEVEVSRGSAASELVGSVAVGGGSGSVGPVGGPDNDVGDQGGSKTSQLDVSPSSGSKAGRDTSSQGSLLASSAE